MSAVRALFVSLFVSFCCFAQGLVKDINPTPSGANPSSSPGEGVYFSFGPNPGFYFAADDARHGRELWRSDGTSTGTVFVVDVRPGASGSGPQDLTVFGNALYFTADDGTHGRELWKTDGTPAGTALVADVVPGAAGSDPTWLRAASTRLYFSAATPASGRELWSTGPAGTSLVADLNPGSANGFSGGLVVQKTGTDRVAFFGDDGVHGLEPVTSTGTSAVVYDLQSGGGSSPQQMVAPSSGATASSMCRSVLRRSRSRPLAADRPCSV